MGACLQATQGSMAQIAPADRLLSPIVTARD
jgi:hypothetical protein